MGLKLEHKNVHMTVNTQKGYCAHIPSKGSADNTKLGSDTVVYHEYIKK